MGTQIRLRQDPREILFGQISDVGACVALQGKGQDLLALQHTFWDFRLHVTEERMQHREAMVLGAIAILAGDALMTRCYQVLADIPRLSDPVRLCIIREIAAATGTVDGMIGGQVVDLESEGKPISAHALEYIHYSKTGALLKACIRCGALAAGADVRALHALTEFGQKIGLVFQIVDDILDITSSSEVLGKTAGKDEKVKKATYPAFYGIEASKQKARELANSAMEDIRDFGEAAQFLRGIATFIVSRTA